MEEAFNKAQEDVRTLTTKPDNNTLLKLYALYKQATEGDNTREKPNLFDMRATAKYNAWMNLQGMTSEEAMQEYVDLVSKLLEDNETN